MKTHSKDKKQLSRREMVKATSSIGLSSILLGASAVAQSTSMLESMGDDTQEGYEGNIAVCTVMIVKSELEKDADSVWDRHKKWLKETHGPWGMVSYTVAKNEEVKSPLNPASNEKTGRIIYVIHEVYRDIEGLNKHYSESPNGGYVEDFLKIATADGSSVTVLQGATITHSLLPKDCDFPVTISEVDKGVEEFFDKKE